MKQILILLITFATLTGFAQGPLTQDILINNATLSEKLFKALSINVRPIEFVGNNTTVKVIQMNDGLECSETSQMQDGPESSEANPDKDLSSKTYSCKLRMDGNWLTFGTGEMTFKSLVLKNAALVIELYKAINSDLTKFDQVIIGGKVILNIRTISDIDKNEKRTSNIYLSCIMPTAYALKNQLQQASCRLLL